MIYDEVKLDTYFNKVIVPIKIEIEKAKQENAARKARKERKIEV